MATARFQHGSVCITVLIRPLHEGDCYGTCEARVTPLHEAATIVREESALTAFISTAMLVLRKMPC